MPAQAHDIQPSTRCSTFRFINPAIKTGLRPLFSGVLTSVGALSVVCLALLLSGCSVWNYVATDTTGRTDAGTYNATTSAYSVTVVEETTLQQSCTKRLLYYHARGGLHSRPHVDEAHAEDRDCDMLIDNVRLTRAADRRAWVRNRGYISSDLEEAYYKALTQ